MKTTPASSGSGDVPSTVSTAALSSVCSASMTENTATANPAPRRSVSPPSVSFTAATLGGGSFCRRAKNHGTTSSDANGPAAIPIATAVCPDVTPTTTANAKQTRAIASMKTSAPYSSKRWWPARKPRAK